MNEDFEITLPESDGFSQVLKITAIDLRVPAGVAVRAVLIRTPTDPLYARLSERKEQVIGFDAEALTQIGAAIAVSEVFAPFIERIKTAFLDENNENRYPAGSEPYDIGAEPIAPNAE